MKFLTVVIVAVIVFSIDVQAIPVGGRWILAYVVNTGNNLKSSNSIIKDEVLDISKDIVTGSYEYVSPEGKIIKVTYTAGAGIGFNPRSTEDVIPAAIIDAIELNLKNPPETS